MVVEAESSWKVWCAILGACIASRLVSAIYYIEDPDSLRFALSVADAYDVTGLQPHFPGYPVFWAAAKALYLLTGRYAVAFALVGGLATFGVLFYTIRLFRLAIPQASRTGAEWLLAGLAFFSPLVWLMGNRYMPDLMGLAVAMAAFYYLAAALTVHSADRSYCRARTGIVLAALLAGLRLSYLPFVLPPVLLVLARSQRPGQLVGWGAAGVIVWLAPMVMDTGAAALVEAARRQTTGHFTEFGGTVQTNANLLRRLAGFIEGVWADGLGGYWTGRHPLTVVVAVGAAGLLAAGAYRDGGSGTQRLRGLMALSWLAYAVWILLYQNVIHKSRHVLPLLPFLLMLMARGGAVLSRSGRLGRLAVGVFLAAYAAVTIVLVGQHRQPSAVAQAKQFVQEQANRADTLYVASIPLVNYFLSAQDVEARFLSIEQPADRRRLQAVAGEHSVLVVGTYSDAMPAAPDRDTTFYHNPYVNRMWPEVDVYLYELNR